MGDCRTVSVDLLKLSARWGTQGPGDEFNDPMEMAFGVNLFRDGVIEDCRGGCRLWLSKLVSGNYDASLHTAHVFNTFLIK